MHSRQKCTIKTMAFMKNELMLKACKEVRNRMDDICKMHSKHKNLRFEHFATNHDRILKAMFINLDTMCSWWYPVIYVDNFFVRSIYLDNTSKQLSIEDALSNFEAIVLSSDIYVDFNDMTYDFLHVFLHAGETLESLAIEYDLEGHA